MTDAVVARLTPADLPGWQPIDLPSAHRPTLFAVVDTEEEFDWAKPFSRASTRVRAMCAVGTGQRLLARYGIRPTYVIDYPVATQPDGSRPIQELLQSGECAVGAHLHPWVNPPFDEPLSRRNSFACNLGPLEDAKLRVLASAIGETLGVEPRIYKAGRYGFGPSTAAALERLGFDIDASIMPLMDFAAEGGPSFKALDARPFFFGLRRRLLEVPCTAGYVGAAGVAAPALHAVASAPVFERAGMAGVLSRLRIVEKIVLSPESSSAGEMKRLARALLRRGVRTFALTFHSPSLEPGHTPYVRTRADLDLFLGRIESFCDFFFGALGGVTMTLTEFRDQIEAAALQNRRPEARAS